MKILFALNIGFDKGGPSVHLLTDVIESALSRGHNCHVVLKKTTDFEITGLENLSEKYGDLLCVSLVKDTSKKKGGFVKRYLNDCAYAVKSRKFYKKNNYDVAFLQSCNVAWIYTGFFKRKKLPVVYNVQDIFPQNLMLSSQLPVSKITYPVFCRLQNAAYKRAGKIITISHDMKQTLVEQGIAADKIEVVFNWSYGDDDIRLESIPADRIFDMHMDKSKINVVYAGNIGKMQNVELIAEAAKLSKDDASVHYYIIGDGANKTRVTSMVEGLDNVTILPMQPSRYAESIYAQADINVIPLAKGGIKTALPSKTATVLRTEKPIIFCIDSGSEFEKMVKDSSNIKIADNSAPQSLLDAVRELRDLDTDACSDRGGIRNTFSKNNANKYVDAMENVAVGE